MMRTARSIALLLALGLGSASCAYPAADDDLDRAHAVSALQAPPTTPPVEQVTFDDVSADGSGCKPGTWTKSFNEEKKTLSMTFYEYILYVDPTERLKSLNCAITIKVRVPKSTSFAVARIKYQARAQLVAGMTGRYSVVYAFEGSGTSQPQTSLREIVGPRFDVFPIEDDVALTPRMTWSSCTLKSNLQVRTSLSLQNSQPPSDGLFAVDHLDTIIETAALGDSSVATTAPSLELTLATRPCP